MSAHLVTERISLIIRITGSVANKRSLIMTSLAPPQPPQLSFLGLSILMAFNFHRALLVVFLAL